MNSIQERLATGDDTASIVDLLRLSLGETLMPKSVAFWNWKHVQNPFGPSPVLLAFDGSKLVGVRAFMRWDWVAGENVYRSVRAVDTAVHPDYQGRGIFSRLTSHLAEACTRDGVHFIFNTPNKKSMPGYLKLGWQSIGRLKLRLTPCWPQRSKTFPERDLSDINASFIGEVISRTSFDRIHTRYSYDYIRWRYIENPNASYMALTDHTSWLLIYRLKPLTLGRELRVVDFFGAASNLSDAIRHAGKSGASLITMSGPGAGFVQFPVGPEVTVRMLASSNSITFQSWNPSLGDLELF